MSGPPPHLLQGQGCGVRRGVLGKGPRMHVCVLEPPVRAELPVPSWAEWRGVCCCSMPRAGREKGGRGHTRECVAWGTFGGRTMSGMCRGGGEGAWEEALTRLRRAGPSRESGLAFAAFLGSLAVGSGWVQGGGEDVRESSVTATHTSYTSGSRGDSHTMCLLDKSYGFFKAVPHFSGPL